jgi:hypothetical protein
VFEASNVDKIEVKREKRCGDNQPHQYEGYLHAGNWKRGKYKPGNGVCPGFYRNIDPFIDPGFSKC